MADDELDPSRLGLRQYSLYHERLPLEWVKGSDLLGQRQSGSRMISSTLPFSFGHPEPRRSSPRARTVWLPETTCWKPSVTHCAKSWSGMPSRSGSAAPQRDGPPAHSLIWTACRKGPAACSWTVRRGRTFRSPTGVAVVRVVVPDLEYSLTPHYRPGPQVRRALEVHRG